MSSTSDFVEGSLVSGWKVNYLSEKLACCQSFVSSTTSKLLIIGSYEYEHILEYDTKSCKYNIISSYPLNIKPLSHTVVSYIHRNTSNEIFISLGGGKQHLLEYNYTVNKWTNIQEEQATDFVTYKIGKFARSCLLGKSSVGVIGFGKF